MIDTGIKNTIRKSSIGGIERYLRVIKKNSAIPLISEWAETDRYLPPGTTEHPGLVDHKIAPHLVEIADCLHPDSDIQQVSVMKSTQSLVTTAFEHVIGHSIKYKLHNILYIISSKNIAGIRSSSAIDVMIDNSDLAQFVKPISQRMKKKVADNKYYKEFHGGRRLMMTSWNSVGDSKSLTWSLIIMDEIDEAPYELAGQGDPESMFAGRAKTIRNLKIAKLGTPTTTQGRIYRNFLEGDQRYYFAQCPLCGEKQVLIVSGMGKKYGLRARFKEKENRKIIIPDSVEYICKFCKKPISEYQKQSMMLGGEWRPTARPVNPRYRSYQISNLMSPVMFFTWARAMQEFLETDFGENVTKYKNFMIDTLGVPWEQRAGKMNWKQIRQRAEDYNLKTIPANNVVLTAGVDVQKRWLEMVVVAWGPGMEAWIIDHQQFWGNTYDKGNQVWKDLQAYLSTQKYRLNKKINMPIAMAAIDTGYNPKGNNLDESVTTEHTVYEVVARTPRSIACRGDDKLVDSILKQQRIKRAIPLKVRYDVAVSELKDEITVKLNLPVEKIEQEYEYPRGYIHFSKHLGDEFFRGFMSEVFAEILPNKWGWKKLYERNEPLDCFILARAAAERLNLPSWSDEIWKNYYKTLVK